MQRGRVSLEERIHVCLGEAAASSPVGAVASDWRNRRADDGGARASPPAGGNSGELSAKIAGYYLASGASRSGRRWSEEALALARAWASLPRHYREPIRSWIIMASIHDQLPEELKQLPPSAQGLERRNRKR